MSKQVEARLRRTGYKLQFLTNGEVIASRGECRYIAKSITGLRKKIYGY